MRNPWASTFDITKAWPTTQTSCTASIRGLRELFLTRTRSSTWTSTLTAGQPSLSFSSFSSVFLENWMLWFNTHPLNIYEGKQTSQSFFILDWPLIVLPEIKFFHRALQTPRWFNAPGNVETNWLGLDLWGLAKTARWHKTSHFCGVRACLYASLCSRIVRMVPHNYTWDSVEIYPVSIYTGCDLHRFDARFCLAALSSLTGLWHNISLVN